MVILPVVHGSSAAGALIPIVSVIAACTLLPAMLASWAPASAGCG
jgi:hypothetical protein